MTVVQFAKSGEERPKPDLPELGAPGNHFFRGFLVTDEYVPDLTGAKGLETFEKMRRSDGMVSGCLRAMKLPILSATWGVTPASADENDVTVANFVRWNLFEGMTTSWLDHLRECLTHLDFGFYVAEKVWEVRDSIRMTIDQTPDDPGDEGSRQVVKREVTLDRPMYVLRKLAPRLQRTIQKWNLADDGGLDSVTQWAFKSAGGYREATIPVDKLLVFVNEKEGAIWSGKSVLRPAYKHWLMKDTDYRIDAIAAERHGVGIPVMALPEGKNDDATMDRAEDILVGIRAHERGYVVEPFGYKFSVEGMGQGRAMDLLPIIQHHDRMIAVSVLAPQLALGENAQGSFAMHEGQDSFFMLAERAIADHVADIHNRYLIPQLVDFNFPGVARYPKLTYGAIETRDIEKLLNALVPAVNAGLITADEPLEAALRKIAALPERDPKTAREKPATPVAIGGASGEKPPADPGTKPPAKPRAGGSPTSENPKPEGGADA